MHVPSGLFAYGLYQNDQEDGTQIKNVYFPYGPCDFVGDDSAANETDTWFVKAGIKRAWMPAGATVLFGEWGQYNDMFRGLCGERARQPRPASATASAMTILPIGVVGQRDLPRVSPSATGSLVTGSEVHRWGIGVVQEIDSAAMHLFARWQHLDLNLRRRQLRLTHRRLLRQRQVRQRRQHQLRRSRYLPGWRRDLLLNEQTTFQIEAAPSGGFFFGTCACCRSQTGCPRARPRS